MKKITINKINEDIYYEKLDNGLDVYLYVNKNMQNNYVTFTTKYGSIYNEFEDENGKIVKVPNGIAHFLEHKVFVQKDDPQPEEYYGANGALCNAYTTFKNTTYLKASEIISLDSVLCETTRLRCTHKVYSETGFEFLCCGTLKTRSLVATSLTPPAIAFPDFFCTWFRRFFLL